MKKFFIFKLVTLSFLIFLSPNSQAAEGLESKTLPTKYMKLAAYWSPDFVHASKNRGDWPSMYNADSDWDMSNNAAHFDAGDFQSPATIYLDLFETEDAYVLVYTIYNPRDEKTPVDLNQYARTIPRWIRLGKLAGSTNPHEHDSEGVVLYIKKDGTPYGRFFFALTRGYLWNVPYAAGADYLDSLRNFDSTAPVTKSIPFWATRILSGVYSLQTYLDVGNPFFEKHHRRNVPGLPNRAIPLLFIEHNGAHPVFLVGPKEDGHGIFKYNPMADAVDPNRLARVEYDQDAQKQMHAVGIEAVQGMVSHFRGNDEASPESVREESPVPSVKYQLLPTIETLLPPELRDVNNKDWLAEMRKRFHYISQDPKECATPTLDPNGPVPYAPLPKCFCASDPKECEANPFWAWSYLGIDPIGYLYARFPEVAKKENLSKHYLFNELAKPSASHVATQDR